MINSSLLAVFIPTCVMISLTPGMCMTLSLTLGMSIGIKRTFWMMWGELAGVALVSTASVAGVAAIMLTHPALFTLLKYCGGLYLLYLGVRMWRSGDAAVHRENVENRSRLNRKALALNGFVTAVSNPKGWAFMISLLPPFIDQSYPLVPQLAILLSVLLLIEFLCLVIYATGGKQLSTFLSRRGGGSLLNRIAGTLMIGLGAWLALD